MIENYLAVSSLGVDYWHQGKKVRALDSVDLTLDRGKMGVVIGPSGCGKSTLMSVLAGLNTAYTGQVLIDGKTPTGLETALILQILDCTLENSVENIVLGLKIRKELERDKRGRQLILKR